VSHAASAAGIVAFGGKALIARVLSAAASRALSAGKVDVSESEFVQITRTIVIGANNTVVTGQPTDAWLRSFVAELVAHVQQTPGLSITLTMRPSGERVLRFEHAERSRLLAPEDVG
jgi:hypothetical protein